MELKFIWVKEFRILKDLGINFNHSGEHKFDFSKNNLNLLPNPAPVINFGDNITGVTVIAGENGSGKSSICEIALHTTATLVNGAMGYDEPFTGIVCYGKHIFYHQDLKIENLEQLKLANYTVVAFKNTPFEEMKEEWINHFITKGFIYYSNVIDWRSNLDLLNLANISTQRYIEEDGVYGTFYTYENHLRRDPPYPQLDKHWVPNSEAYWYGQNYRFLKFYLEYKDILPVKSPQYIMLFSSCSETNKFLNAPQDNSAIFKEFERNIFNMAFPEVNYNQQDFVTTDHKTLKEAIHYLYRLNLLLAHSISSKQFGTAEQIHKFVFLGKGADVLFSDLKNVETLITTHKKLIDLSFLPDGMQVSYLQNRYKNNWRFGILEYVYLNNNSETQELLDDFIFFEELVLRSENNSLIKLSNFSMHPQMSSGEVSFYSLFSRILDITDRYNNGYDERDKIVLFIDEAEIGFHPAWKKKFFNWLLVFLSTMPEYEFQLIITTHSPYLLSDVPAENVMLLQKTESGCKILPKDTIKTFGANIHELLSDSFFLKDGFIGDFAKIILNELFSYLSGGLEATDTLNQKKAKTLIDLVGEPLLKSQLVQLYDSKFGANTELDFINEEIERLEQLKNKIKNDSNNKSKY